MKNFESAPNQLNSTQQQDRVSRQSQQQTSIESILRRPLLPEDIPEWSDAHFSTASIQSNVVYNGFMVFRIGEQWLALAAHVLEDVTDSLPTHRLPYARHPAVRGVVNLHGAVTLKISLGMLMGLSADNAPPQLPRHIAIKMDEHVTVFEVDDILGLEQIPLDTIMPVPAALHAATNTFTKTIFYIGQRCISVIDVDRLRTVLNKQLS